MIGADNGLFRYDGQRVTHIASEPTGSVDNLHDEQGEVLLSTDNGLFQMVAEPNSTAKVNLDNWSELRGAAPNRLGVPTRWVMNHRCAAFADQFGLYVIATNAQGEDVGIKPATAFQPHGDAVSFEATVPVADDGKWTFRVVSMASGIVSNIGEPSEPVTFVTPGIVGWISSWWRTIAGSSAFLLVTLNLIIFAFSRSSASAWALATDASWGKTMLLPQALLLRLWQIAQLWLLDLYVQERRKALRGKTLPFLSMPLTGSDGRLADSKTVLARLASARHLWLQGVPGMGKTATFLHLRQTHFGQGENTSFAIFRRDGYVLVPIEARRFPEAPSDEKGASGWMTACALSVLSESGLSLEDRGLLRAMLKKGTLAIAVDGVNEVAHGQAVSAFAAEFPTAPLFVTSQETGEPPFEVWRLPVTIAEHVDGLLALYLGEERGKELAQRLRDCGLIRYLCSGYDVRLVIDIAEADPGGTSLPHDRIGLYSAAVTEAWPEGDLRLELLQAAAWKLISERGPNEDKRRLMPDVDAPKDLLERLEAVRERSGRSIRLIRRAPPGYEFVHDQMNAYLAARWFADRATVATMKDLLQLTKVWQDGLEAQRTLWGFIAAMLDRAQLEALWIFAGDDDRRGVLGRALAERAEREGWPLTRPPAKASLQDDRLDMQQEHLAKPSRAFSRSSSEIP